MLKDNKNLYFVKSKHGLVARKKTRIQHEAKMQKECFARLKKDFPELMTFIFHIPNGGKRNAKEAKLLKAEGVMAGVSDIFVFIPSKGFHGHFIELKHGKGKLSEAQKVFFARAQIQGYQTSVCRSVDEFIQTLQRYLGQ